MRDAHRGSGSNGFTVGALGRVRKAPVPVTTRPKLVAVVDAAIVLSVVADVVGTLRVVVFAAVVLVLLLTDVVLVVALDFRPPSSHPSTHDMSTRASDPNAKPAFITPLRMPRKSARVPGISLPGVGRAPGDRPLHQQLGHHDPRVIGTSFAHVWVYGIWSVRAKCSMVSLDAMVSPSQPLVDATT